MQPKPIPDYPRKTNNNRLPLRPANDRLVRIDGIRPDRLAFPSENLHDQPMYVREMVMNLLLLAAAKLPAGYRLIVWDGWRSTDKQKRLFDEAFDTLRARFPNADKSELTDLVELYVSAPSEEQPHLTGGAVDVSLMDEKGAYLSKDVLFNASPDRHATRYLEEQLQQRELSADEMDELEKRRWLYHAMVDVGFTSSPDKWWHYDFGNAQWAAATGKAPFYGAIEAKQTKA